MSSSPPEIARSSEVDGLPAPTGPFAWTVAHGDVLYISGLRGIDESSGEVVAGDAERVGLIFAHLRAALDSHGCGSDDVLATRVYVTDMDRIRPLVNDAYRDFFGDHLPTRTIVEVRALNDGDSVEVEAVARRRAPDAGQEAGGGAEPR